MTVKVILNETTDGTIEVPVTGLQLPTDAETILSEARDIAVERGNGSQVERLDYLVNAVREQDYRILQDYQPISLTDDVINDGAIIGFNGKHKSGH